MSALADYVDALVAEASEERIDPLKRELAARLKAEPTVFRGRASPLPDRDTPFTGDPILRAYDRVAAAGNVAAIRRLREATVDLFVEALNAPGSGALVGPAAVLVGSLDVRADEELRLRLRQLLFGFLASGLPAPMDKLLALDGSSVARALVALGVWVAVTPVGSPVADHVVRGIEELVEQACEEVEGAQHLPDERLRLWLLSWRALCHAGPARGGATFWRVAAVAERWADSLPAASKRFLGTCRDVRDELRGHPASSTRFADAVREAAPTEVSVAARAGLLRLGLPALQAAVSVPSKRVRRARTTAELQEQLRQAGS